MELTSITTRRRTFSSPNIRLPSIIPLLYSFIIAIIIYCDRTNSFSLSIPSDKHILHDTTKFQTIIKPDGVRPPRSESKKLSTYQSVRSSSAKRDRSGYRQRDHDNSATRLHMSLYTQVISDVDDTLKSSGGVNVAGVALGGIDVQYKRGSIYPGVAEFMLQVSLGVPNSNNDEKTPIIPPKVAILTARAEEFKMALELKESNPISIAFKNAAEQFGIGGWGIGPVLYGSVAEWILQDRKGLRKFSNFELLLKQDPTGSIFQYIYVGDTGELDQQAGETMLREYPEVVKAVFLHVVSGQPEEDIIIPPPKLINGRPIIFFRTYVGAAVAAVQLGLMTLDGLEIVADAACDQLANVPKSSDKWRDINRDLDDADALLLL